MSLAKVLPLAIDLSEEDRTELMQEIAKSMGLEVVDLEVDLRRTEMESDPVTYSLSADEMKAELQRLRNGG